MKSVQILGLLVAASALGAVAGGVVGAFTQGAAPVSEDPLLDRLSEIDRSIGALRDAAADVRNDVADVRERIVAVELELSRRAEEAAAGASTLPAELRAIAEDPMAAIPGGGRSIVLSGGVAGASDRLEAAEAAMAAAKAEQGRLVKGLKIRAMPEEERWRYAADTLRLNSVQVDEIRAAHEELQEALKEAVVEERTDAGGGLMTFRRIDGNKVREARDAFAARVDNTLDAEQQKAWKEEGLDHAFGRRSSLPLIRMRSASDDGRPATVEAAGIEIVTTEVRTNDGDGRK